MLEWRSIGRPQAVDEDSMVLVVNRPSERKGILYLYNDILLRDSFGINDH